MMFLLYIYISYAKFPIRFHKTMQEGHSTLKLPLLPEFPLGYWDLGIKPRKKILLNM